MHRIIYCDYTIMTVWTCFIKNMFVSLIFFSLPINIKRISLKDIHVTIICVMTASMRA